MHHCFLNEIDFDEITSVYPVSSDNIYQRQDILSTIFHSINLGIPSIEGLKLINPSDMGLLIGHNRGPDKKTIRRQLAEIGKLYQSDALIDNFAQVLLEQNFIDREVFFIDGHFLPYYGLKVIAKGYYTVRRLAMKSNELYTITDLQGRPLFFITESNEIDFRPIISRSVKKLKEYGIDRPILVFDRGGYGIHFFTQLDKDADFISWAKYVGDKALNSITDTDFTVGLSFCGHNYEVAEQSRTVKESVQTAKKEGRSEPAVIDLRMIVLKNVDTGKRIAVYTNNRNLPMTLPSTC
ncbi:putative transposase [Desulfocicer niacini]